MYMHITSTERLLKCFCQLGVLGLLLGLFRRRPANNTSGSRQARIVVVRFGVQLESTVNVSDAYKRGGRDDLQWYLLIVSWEK